MKILFFDTETTGVNPQLSAIHQLAGMVVVDGAVKEMFNFRIKPHEGAEIKEAALEVSGVNRQIISLYPNSADQLKAFQSILLRYVDKYNKTDKFYLAGYNSRAFDEPFLRNWFLVNGDNYFGSYFWQVGFDVMVLAAEKLKHDLPEMPNFQLHTVAAHLGLRVESTRLHDALYDVELTRGIYEALANPIDAVQLAKKVLAVLEKQQAYFHASRTGSALKGFALEESKKEEAELKAICTDLTKPIPQPTLF